MAWSAENQRDYSRFMDEYVRTYDRPLDCADLALSGLATFAGREGLQVKLFDYEQRPRRWLNFDPQQDDWRAYRERIMEQLGAINVIENTVAISLEDARAGDLIMTQRHAEGSTGHTRIVTESRWDEAADDYFIVWYQGTLPPVVPERRESHFRQIGNVYGNSPRRWNFSQFN